MIKKREENTKKLLQDITENNIATISESKDIKRNHKTVKGQVHNLLQSLYPEKIETYSKALKTTSGDIKFIRYRDSIYLSYAMCNKNYKYQYYAKYICNIEDVKTKTMFKTLQEFVDYLNSNILGVE